MRVRLLEVLRETCVLLWGQSLRPSARVDVAVRQDPLNTLAGNVVAERGAKGIEQGLSALGKGCLDNFTECPLRSLWEQAGLPRDKSEDR